MFAALKSELIRILSLRSSLIYAILLTGTFYGPMTLLVVFFASEVNAPIGISELFIGSMFFLPIAVIFGAASTASEIRHGSTALSFLVQRHRWTSFVARVVANWLFIAINYVVGLGLAIGVSNFNPAGLELGDKFLPMAGLMLGSALFWNAIGVATGFIFRGVAMAVTLPLLWITVAETMMGVLPVKFFAELATWAPYGLTTSQLPGWIIGNEPLHSPAQMFGVLAAILAAFIAAGWALHTRRDVLA